METLWLLLLLALLVPPTDTHPGLSAPTNVHIDSYNMKHVLRWAPVEAGSETGLVTYHVKFVMHNDIRDLCVNIMETKCDFSEKVLPFWRGVVMVQAALGSRTSDWAMTPQFQASKNTAMGPVTSLTLVPYSDKVKVDFSPPFSPVPHYWKMYYELIYWKEDSSEQKMIDLGDHTGHTLPDLEPETTYCVQVNVSTDYIVGQQSKAVCATTKAREVPEVSESSLTAILLGLGVTLVVLAIIVWVLYKYPVHRSVDKVKNFLKCPYRIPPHLQQYFENPPQCNCLEVAELTASDQCDHVSIVGLDLCQGDDEERSDRSQPEPEKT